MLFFREIRREDVFDINKWRNDPELINNLLAPFRYISIEVDYDWFEDYMQKRNSMIRCAIADTANEADILGIISLTNIDFFNRCAEVHIIVDKEVRGKGIGSFAVKQILNYAFNHMNFNRIELEVLEYNDRAIKLYEKFGFEKEAYKRQSVYKNGIYANVIIMSVLREEFLIKFGGGDSNE